MNTINFVAVAATLMAVAMPVSAGTQANNAKTTIRIHGIVPVICRVQVSASLSSPNTEGVANLGTADEFCNAPRGYRVIVRHPANLEGAALIRGGTRIPLSTGGETVITDSDQPNLHKVALSVDLGDHPERFNTLGFRIEAKS